MPDVSDQIQQSQKIAQQARANALQAQAAGMAQVQQAQSMVQAVVQQAQAASQSHVDGALSLNAAPYTVARCVSGQLTGFNGVDVMGVDGSRLRLVKELDGSGTVIHMGTAANPVTMKACSKIDVQPANVSVNDVRVLRGSAQVDCT
jgi:hypothetical protein